METKDTRTLTGKQFVDLFHKAQESLYAEMPTPDELGEKYGKQLEALKSSPTMDRQVYRVMELSCIINPDTAIAGALIGLLLVGIEMQKLLTSGVIVENGQAEARKPVATRKLKNSVNCSR